MFLLEKVSLAASFLQLANNLVNNFYTPNVAYTIPQHRLSHIASLLQVIDANKDMSEMKSVYDEYSSRILMGHQF